MLRYHLFLLISFLWMTPQLEAQDFQVQNLPLLDGVGQSQLFALLEDSRKFIWIGTRGAGLLRYDGRQIQTYQAQSGSYVQALYEGAEGGIWLGSEKGLLRFDGTTFETFPLKSTEPIEIAAITQTNDGQVWAGTNRGLYHLVDGQMERMPLGNADARIQVFDCLHTRKGNLWLATNQGLWQIVNKRAIQYTPDHGLNSLDIRSLAEDRQGRLWAANYDAGINILQGGEMERWEGSDSMEEKGGVLELYLDEKDHPWLGMERSGLLIWQAAEKNFQQIRNVDGLESNQVRSVIQDSWGNQRVGTAGGGLSTLTPSRKAFSHYASTEGLPDSDIRLLYKDPFYGFWIANSTQLFYFDGQEFSNYSERSAWPDMRIVAMQKDTSGRLWVATQNNGLLVVLKDRILTITKDGGLPSNRIQDMCMDSSGGIWLATANRGATLIRPQPDDSIGLRYAFDYFNSDNGWPDYLSAFHLDQRQRLWWADADGQMGNYMDSLRLSSNRKLRIQHLTEDRLGYLWGSTQRQGIFRLNIYRDSLRFQFFDQSNQLTSNNCYFVLPDGEEHLWVGNPSGVDYVGLEEGRIAGNVRFYGNAQGFRGGPTGRHPALLDEDGQFWCGTANGLMQFTGNRASRENKAPVIQLNRVRLGNQDIGETAYAGQLDQWGNWLGQLLLPHTINDIRFDFIGIDYGQPRAIRYQSKLLGRSDDWGPPTTSPIAEFSNLSPGNYTFTVKATDGQLESAPLALDFVIEPPFWQTSWFRWTAGLAGLLFLLGLFRLRLRAVQQKAAREKARLEMEKHLLQLEQKALQLQMNPHFIFNALNTIQSQINETDHRSARYQLAKFAKLMRLILENSRAEKIPLEDEIQTLQNYLAIESYSRGDSFEYVIEIDDRLDTEETHIPPMMIQPFVENAIIHGVAHLTKAGKVLVDFRLKGRFLECVIEDNGIGRRAARERKSQQDAQHKSVALEVTQERLSLLNGLGEKGLQIEDVLDGAGTICGTRVRLLFLLG